MFKIIDKYVINQKVVFLLLFLFVLFFLEKNILDSLYILVVFLYKLLFFK